MLQSPSNSVTNGLQPGDQAVRRRNRRRFRGVRRRWRGAIRLPIQTACCTAKVASARSFQCVHHGASILTLQELGGAFF
jgi:hypothetical protein